MCKLLLFVLLSGSISLVTCFGLLGPGQWLVLNVEECENPEQYPIFFKVSRTKVNRTHDCFNMDLNLDRDFDHNLAILIDIYKEMDGGFKFYQTMSDDSACRFLMRYAHDNVKRAMTLGRINPTDFPIKPGKYEMNDFIMDYTEINDIGVYGTFRVFVYLLLAGQKLACVEVLLNFDKRNGEE